MVKEINPGDTVRLKKPHPCGSYEWEIIRLGTDVRIKCVKCGHTVLIGRSELERRIKGIVTRENK